MLAFGALLVGACGGGDDGQLADEAPASETPDATVDTSQENPTTTAVAQQVSIDSSVLPYAVCDEGLAELFVFDPTTGESTSVISELEGMCNMNGTLTDTNLSSSGEYLVSIWPAGFGTDSSLDVISVATGERVHLDNDQFSAWATEQTSTGLDARERRVRFSGFDRSGDGRLILDEYISESGGGHSYRYYQLDVPALISSGGVIDPTEIDGPIECYASTKWSGDGSKCIDGYANSSSIFDATEQSPATELWNGGHTWAGDLTYGSSSGGRGRSVRIAGAGIEAFDVYEIEGSRTLRVWGSPSSDVLYFLSETLDESEVEVYSVAAEAGSVPELIGVVPIGSSPIDR